MISHSSFSKKNTQYLGFLTFYISLLVFSPRGSTAQFWALAASMKLSVSFWLIDLGQKAGVLGRLISSSQGLC
jgi:hypothetical protein